MKVGKLDVKGNITMQAGKTVDGRDVSADGSTLDNLDANAVLKSLFNAQTVLVAVTDDTPVPITVQENEFVGRNVSGNVGALSALVADGIVNTRNFTNNTGGALTHGQAVYKTSTTGEIALAKADAAATAKFTGAVRLSTGIPNASVGQVQKGGAVAIPNALQLGGAWAEGDLVYLSEATAGSYTKVAPSTIGQFVLRIGEVVGFSAGPGSTAFVLVDRGDAAEVTAGGGGASFDIDNQITTTDATQTTLGSYATTSDDRGIEINGNIISRSSGGDVKRWRFTLLARRGTGAGSAEVLDMDDFSQESTPLPWSITADDDGSGNLRIRFTGQAATTIKTSIKAFAQESE